MNKEEILEIADKVANGTATALEIEQYIYYLNWSAQESSLWEELPTSEKLKIQEDIRHSLAVNLKPVKLIPFYRKLKWIAAILLFASISSTFIYLFYTKNEPYNESDQFAVQDNFDIAPAKEGATLTLADGRVIDLDDAATGDIAEQLGVKIFKTEDGQIRYAISDHENTHVGFNTLKTNRGEQIQVLLPDQTLVFLNAASTLTYPSRFLSGQPREVTLTGEGYFEVKHDPLRPFLVNSDKQQIEVLGTHFNVNAYSDETHTRTALLEGSVKVKNAHNTVILAPGEASSVRASSSNISLHKEADLKEAIAWKSGYFQFNEAGIETIMRQLARWYDLQVEYEGEIPLIKFNGKIQRDLNLSAILEFLKTDIHFERKGNVILIKPKN